MPKRWPTFKIFPVSNVYSKGQLIPKCSFSVIIWTKIPTILLKISALASKKMSNQKKSLIR